MTEITREDELPSIKDVRDRFTTLVDHGFGELPVEAIAVPDSTLQAIARVVTGGDYEKSGPVLQLCLSISRQGPHVMMISSERSADEEGMPTTQTQ